MPGKLRSHILWASAALALGTLYAQQDTTFSTDVNVVNIFATVRDKQLKIVNTMAKDDFALSEEGHPQTIRYFSRETDLPLTLGLLVDTSLSQRRVLEEEKDASYRFLDQVLRPEKDQTFVIHFDHDTELLQDLTSSRTDLRKALDAVRLPDDARPQMRQGGGGYPNGNGGNRRQAGTTLYDAIFLASDEIMKKQHGRKALILLTDGVDEGSKTSLYESIRAAQRSDTLVYSILFSDREGIGQSQAASIILGGLGGGRRGGMGPGGQGNGQRPDGKKILQQISRETGGGFFEVSKKESIGDIYKSIEEELRNQYSIGYVSDQANASTGFRHITLTARRSGVTIQALKATTPLASRRLWYPWSMALTVTDRIQDESELDQIFPSPAMPSIAKVTTSLTPAYRRMIEASPFVTLATSGPGGLDCSPRGDAPGFVRAADDGTILLPERRGNNRIDTLRNLIHDPRIALLFLIPGIAETMRVNGTAVLSRNAGLCASFTVQGKAPQIVIVVSVETVYFQCARAIVRSSLWDPSRFRNAGDLPSAGIMLAEASAGAEGGADYDARLPERIRTSLY